MHNPWITVKNAWISIDVNFFNLREMVKNIVFSSKKWKAQPEISLARSFLVISHEPWAVKHLCLDSQNGLEAHTHPTKSKPVSRATKVRKKHYFPIHLKSNTNCFWNQKDPNIWENVFASHLIPSSHLFAPRHANIKTNKLVEQSDLETSMDKYQEIFKLHRFYITRRFYITWRFYNIDEYVMLIN